MKTQTKIALIFFIFSLSTVIFLSISIYFFTSRYSFDDFYKRLEIRAVVNARMLDSAVVESSVLKEVRRLHLERLPNEKEFFFEILDGDRPAAAEIPGVPEAFFAEIVREGKAKYRVRNTFYSGLRHKGQLNDYIVVVSADNYYNTHHLRYLRNVFLVGILATAVLTLAISVLFSRTVFNPVKRITTRVKEIGSRNLSLRLDDGGGNDEIAELQQTFNNMLDRLQAVFATQQNFISNASHELNTPLTAIIGQAEVALSKPRHPTEYTETLQIILRKAERLEQITRSLLNLARTGFDGKLERSERFRADELLWNVKNTIDMMYANNKVELNLSELPENPESLKVRGNEHLLHTALSNIVSNACKYSQSRIIITIRSSAHKIWIIVRDYGIGIPEAELRYIYDPFFRASNAKDFEGYGIGLPLAKNIIRLHNGDINIRSIIGAGTTVEISLPIDRLQTT